MLVREEWEAEFEEILKVRMPADGGVTITRGQFEELVEAYYSLLEALALYANPDSYFGIAILPDPPAGDFAEDWSCVIGPHGDHDHRHGHRARVAVDVEFWGAEPCQEYLDWRSEHDEDDDG